MSLEKRDLVVNELLQLLKTGVIEECTSRWNAPIVLASKCGGGKRLCFDFLLLDEITVKKLCRPPPLFEECLSYMENASVFSQIDLEKGYYQIPMDEESRELTAFMTPIGKIHSVKMPFAIINTAQHSKP